MTTRTRILTGITTTGTPHLGNYAGAIRPAILASQDANADSFYFLADYHALIKCDDPQRIQRSRMEIAATWLAGGLDVDRVTFYRQSDIPEIPELTWLLTCVAAKGLLNRAHAYKASVDKNVVGLQEGLAKALEAIENLKAQAVQQARETAAAQQATMEAVRKLEDRQKEDEAKLEVALEKQHSENSSAAESALNEFADPKTFNLDESRPKLRPFSAKASVHESITFLVNRVTWLEQALATSEKKNQGDGSGGGGGINAARLQTIERQIQENSKAINHIKGGVLNTEKIERLKTEIHRSASIAVPVGGDLIPASMAAKYGGNTIAESGDSYDNSSREGRNGEDGTKGHDGADGRDGRDGRRGDDGGDVEAMDEMEEVEEVEDVCRCVLLPRRFSNGTAPAVRPSPLLCMP